MFDPTACPPVWSEGRLFHAQRFLQPSPVQLSQSVVSPPATLETQAQASRVLIVDDDRDNLFYAECAVEDLGYQWASTALGSMVLPLAMAYQPDIILLDIWLKDITGFDVFRQLRQHSQTSQIPTIAVTALSMPREVAQISQAGFADYLLKPYLLDGLSKVLTVHLPQLAETASESTVDR